MYFILKKDICESGARGSLMSNWNIELVGSRHVITWHCIKFPLHFHIPSKAFTRFSFRGKVKCVTKYPLLKHPAWKSRRVLGRHGRRCWLRRKSNLTVTLDKTQRDPNIVVNQLTQWSLELFWGAIFNFYWEWPQGSTEGRSPARIKLGALRSLYELQQNRKYVMCLHLFSSITHIQITLRRFRHKAFMKEMQYNIMYRFRLC